jgi:hypothetical protein
LICERERERRSKKI